MDPTYAGAYGRIKAYTTDFLSASLIDELKNIDDLEEITRQLYNTSYREDIDALSALYKNPVLLEMAINRHLISKNKVALFAPPPASKDLIKAYLSKWDIQNIKSIMSSKYLGYTIKESETFLISFRDVPMGIFGGTMSHEDFRVLLSMGSIEDMINYLLKFGYQPMLQHLEIYRKTKDVSMLYSSLDAFYYSRLMSLLKFYNGDEGPLIRFFREEIDSNNIMVLLKAKDLDVAFDRISSFIISGGTLSMDDLKELFSLPSVEDVVARLKDRYNFEDELKTYAEEGTLGQFDTRMKKERMEKYLPTFESQSLSIGSIFSLLLRAEIERENLHSIVYAKTYRLDPSRLRDIIILR